MAQFDELITILKEILNNRFYPKPEYIKGVLGDGLGNVRVPNRPDYNYARFNRGSTESFEIFNKMVPEVEDWPILIGTIPWSPGLVQVVGTDWESYSQSGWGDSISTSNPHAPTHVWRDGFIGADPLSIYMRAIAPARAYSPSTTGSYVYVNSFEYYTGTIWPGTPGVDLQPLMSATPTGSALFAGVYVAPGNTLGVVTGTADVDTAAFDPPSVTFPWGTIPIARVRIYGGQAGLRESDFRDARRLFDFPFTGTVSGSPTGNAGGDLTGTYPNPLVAGLHGYSLLDTAPSEGDILMFTGSAYRPIPFPGGGFPFTNVIAVDSGGAGDYTTIGAAISASSDGDTIIIGPGLYNEQVDVNKSLYIGSLFPEDTIVTHNSADYTFRLSVTGTVVQDLTINNTGASTNPNRSKAVYVNANDCTVRRVKANADGQGTGYQNSGIEVATGITGAFIDDCEGRASNSTNASRGIRMDGDGEIVGGSYNGDDGDISIVGTVELRGPKAENGGIGLANDTTGFALDENDKIQICSQLVGRATLGPDIGSTTAAEKFGNIYLFTDKDLYPGGDEAGVFERETNWDTWDSDFDTFTGWTWDSTDFNGTPSLLDTSTYNSLLWIGDSTAGDSFFAHQSGDDVYGILTKGLDVEVGFRVDDGTNSNFIEAWLVEGTTAGIWRIKVVQQTASTPTTTHYLDQLVPDDYWLYVQRVISVNRSSVWFRSKRGVQGKAPRIHTAIVGSWNGSRAGLVYKQITDGTVSVRSAFLDRIKVF